ncbi:hypothetical protein M407DRAFT_21969 [Tulasnella calospora MUT 4182]|uniref:Uncharacterized protein n=1 Tax=Tulasnella calospora MUT 4182 TaxID=1051891 RepID=A0A0C3M5H7_9AGAM|nr:hypothetical protein M407DRAFT_21969 [Tulasnella calospora MUT 4182]
MSQQAKSSPSRAPAVTNANTAPPPGTLSPQAPSTENPLVFEAGMRVLFTENQEARLAKPLMGPGQASEGRIFDIEEFDFTLSPGAEEWHSSQTTDGRAVYSTVDAVSAGVTIEFQKWDW